MFNYIHILIGQVAEVVTKVQPVNWDSIFAANKAISDSLMMQIEKIKFLNFLTTAKYIVWAMLGVTLIVQGIKAMFKKLAGVYVWIINFALSAGLSYIYGYLYHWKFWQSLLLAIITMFLAAGLYKYIKPLLQKLEK